MYFRDDATFSLTCQCIVCLKFTCRLRRIFPSEKELRERKHTRRRKQREGDSKKKERGSGGEERKSSGRRSGMQIVSNSLFSEPPGCLSRCRRPVEQRVDVWGVS